MGIFRRKKDDHVIENKEDSQGSIYDKDQESFNEESSIKLNSETDLEIQTKSEHLHSVAEKLEKVKSEYEELVGIVMITKKELNEKKSEIDSKKLEYQQLLRQIDEIRRAHV